MGYYIYMTTNLINNKKYIGQHKGSIKDNYLGSGVLLKKPLKSMEKKILKKKFYINVQQEKKQMRRKKNISPYIML